jgi:hypothetical protein
VGDAGSSSCWEGATCIPAAAAAAAVLVMSARVAPEASTAAAAEAPLTHFPDAAKGGPAEFLASASGMELLLASTTAAMTEG